MKFKALFSMLVGVSVLLSACQSAPAPTPAAKAEKPVEQKAAEQKPAAQAAAEQKPAVQRPSGPPIKIGYITPLSGPLGPYGISQQHGVKMAIEEANETGGVNGRPLELTVQDTQGSPQQVVTLMRDLAAKDVAAILGPFTSGEFDVAAPLANQLEVPEINSAASKPGIAPANRPWSFRVNLTDFQQVPYSVQGFKMLYPKAKKLVLVGDVKEAVTQAIFEQVFPKVLTEEGYEIIDRISFQTGTKDFSAVVTRIKGAKPDGIAFTALLAEAIGMSQELERQNVEIPVFTLSQLWAGPFVGNAGKAAKGWIGVALFNPGMQDPATQKFLSKLMPRLEADPAVQKPAIARLEPQAYDAANMMVKVLRDGGVTANTSVKEMRAIIRDGLNNKIKSYRGVVGDITWSNEGEASWKAWPAQVNIDTKNWEVIK